MARILIERLFYNKNPVKIKGSSTEGSESMKRDRQAKWDRENLATISTKLPRKEWIEFKEECWIMGETPYGILRRIVRNWMKEDKLTVRRPPRRGQKTGSPPRD